MRLGAYGLALPDLTGAADILIDAPAEWADWGIVRQRGEGRPPEFVNETHACLRSEPGGWVDVDRTLQTSTLNLPLPVRDHEVVHPYLASTASVAAHWRGMPSFHAGAFVIDDRAWAVLGDRGAGKSSLLAYLALESVPILTDDILVVHSHAALAGPRCIDLRAETASRLGVGEELGVVGTRERWRMAVGPVQPEFPLAGWIDLEWGQPSVTVTPPQERLLALFANLSLRVDVTDPQELLKLAALPMLTLKRPRDFRHLARSATSLLTHLDSRHPAPVTSINRQPEQ